jgi:acetoin utilization deacetylase AcuC-like enzyme
VSPIIPFAFLLPVDGLTGFDSARGDPLGGFGVTPIGYAHMTRMLQQVASGRVVLALEGGYNLDVSLSWFGARLIVWSVGWCWC